MEVRKDIVLRIVLDSAVVSFFFGMIVVGLGMLGMSWLCEGYKVNTSDESLLAVCYFPGCFQPGCGDYCTLQVWRMTSIYIKMTALSWLIRQWYKECVRAESGDDENPSRSSGKWRRAFVNILPFTFVLVGGGLISTCDAFGAVSQSFSLTLTWPHTLLAYIVSSVIPAFFEMVKNVFLILKYKKSCLDEEFLREIRPAHLHND